MMSSTIIANDILLCDLNQRPNRFHFYINEKHEVRNHHFCDVLFDVVVYSLVLLSLVEFLSVHGVVFGHLIKAGLQ